MCQRSDLKLLAVILEVGLTLGFAAAQSGGRPSSENGSGSAKNTQDLRALAEQGVEDLRKQDYLAAIGDYEKLTLSAPGVAEFHSNLCVAYYSVRRFAEAARACKKSLRLNPKLTAPRYFLALSLAEGGECPQAVPLLSAAIASSSAPSSMKRELGLDGANCAMREGDAEHATKFILGLAQDFPDDPEVLYLATRVYSALSTGFSQQLLHVAPGSYQAHQFNAQVLEYQGKLQDAAEEYRKVLALNPRLSGIHYHLGMLLLASGNDDATLKQARQQFEDELQLDPENADAEYELGEMDWQARAWDQAVKHYQRAAQFEPQSPKILVGLGQALVSAGQIKDALEPLKTAVKLAPDDPSAHYQLAFVLRHLGRNEEAVKELALYDELHKKALATGMAIRRGMQESPPGHSSDKMPPR